jgi:hypothetical protein
MLANTLRQRGITDLMVGGLEQMTTVHVRQFLCHAQKHYSDLVQARAHNAIDMRAL